LLKLARIISGKGYDVKPETIEQESFRIIDQETGTHAFPLAQWEIVRRMIHTTADFEFMDTVRFHPHAIEAGLNAVCKGKAIITDTNMARVGLRKNEMDHFKVKATCFISDPKVAETAAKHGITRAEAAVDAALEKMAGGIYVVGNAPTALLRLLELMNKGTAKPALIIGLPVGFVNAAESKESLISMDRPYISNVGRKGGSNLAAAVVNAILIMAKRQQSS
jgi:precorrin-8X/cobalt-precorrin-8 methylmutase